MADEVEEQREDYQQAYHKLKLDYDEALVKYKQQVKAKVRPDNWAMQTLT